VYLESASNFLQALSELAFRTALPPNAVRMYLVRFFIDMIYVTNYKKVTIYYINRK